MWYRQLRQGGHAHRAVDEAARAGSLQGAPGGPVAACQAKAAEVMGNLLPGPFAASVRITCGYRRRRRGGGSHRRAARPGPPGTHRRGPHGRLRHDGNEPRTMSRLCELRAGFGGDQTGSAALSTALGIAFLVFPVLLLVATLPTWVERTVDARDAAANERALWPRRPAGRPG